MLASGERLVTSMFADVRGYTAMTEVGAPAETADRITTLHRWAAAEVGRRHGIVDKFAGDAVMATFNVLGARAITPSSRSRPRSRSATRRRCSISRWGSASRSARPS